MPLPLTLIQSQRQRKQYVNWRRLSTVKGVRRKKIVRALLSQLEIDYDTLTKEEFVTLIGILNKSEHMKKHISRRGKVPAPQRRKLNKR